MKIKLLSVLALSTPAYFAEFYKNKGSFLDSTGI